MIVPVLLAGGTGTRLWPLSRNGYPKQFHKLLGDGSLLQATAQRALQLPDAAPPLVICGDHHRFLVAEQLREIGIDNAAIILEPEGRNTAPAATIAALHVSERYGPEAQVFLMSADHAVDDVAGFCAATATASAVASGQHNHQRSRRRRQKRKRKSMLQMAAIRTSVVMTMTCPRRGSSRKPKN